MDDLRHRFDSLDRLRAPDLWAEVEQRAAAMSSAERLTPVETRTVVVPSRVTAGRPLAVLLVAAALLAALLAGAFAVGSGLLRLPAGPLPSAACPAAIDEADARDTFESGLPAEERAWRRPGTVRPAGQVGPGKIAALAHDLPGVPLRETIVTIDPVTGERCRLVELSRNYQTVPGVSTLEWSPTGDALAIGVGGRLFIWSEAGLARVWIGDAFPFVDWAPNGSSIAVWSGSMGTDEVFAPNPGVHHIFADGSPDQIFDLAPDHRAYGNLRWSPDGTRWAVAQAISGAGVLQDGRDAPDSLNVISVADGTSTPLDLGPSQSLNTVGWLDDQTLLLHAWTHNRPEATRYLTVPIDAPSEYTTLSLPREAVSADRRFIAPDGKRAAYAIEGGGFGLTELAGGESIHAGTETGPVEWVAWAPDGASVVFMTYELDSSDGISGRSIWLVDVDGTGLRLLTQGGLAEGGVTILGEPWQPVPGG